MIFEMRTYRLQPGSVPEVEKRFGEALTERVKVSPLGAFFHTEVGPLNHIIHIWPYDDLQHRTRLRSQSIPNWPPKIQEFMIEMESKIVNAAPSARPLHRGSTATSTRFVPTRCSPASLRRWSSAGPSGSRAGSSCRR